MPRITIKYIFTIIISAFLFHNVSAQDSQYWTQAYGTTSTLLGGIVIGSVSDLGATFYNPGNLSLTDDPNFLFTARVFEFSSLQVDPENSKITNFGTTNICSLLLESRFTFVKKYVEDYYQIHIHNNHFSISFS